MFGLFTSLIKKRCAVNDLLSMLSAFGSDGSDGEDVDGDGTVNVNDLLQLLSAFGSDDCAAGGGGGATCVLGDDCGGQQRTECGTNCPPKCGEPPAGFCVFSCFVGFQCPVRPYILSSMLPSCLAEGLRAALGELVLGRGRWPVRGGVGVQPQLLAAAGRCARPPVPQVRPVRPEHAGPAAARSRGGARQRLARRAMMRRA